MYQQFFQFRRLPFQMTPDPHFFFFTARHEEAFNQALYGVKERKGFMILTGEVGTGKTTLSRLLIEHLGARVKSSLLFNPNLTTVELLQTINRDFGINDQSYSKKILTDELNRFLLDQLMQGVNAMLVVDEAQTLPIECLEEIRLLSNLETPRAKLLQILLIGQPELKDTLALPQLRQLNQRITLCAELEPLSPQEVADYIQYRLWRAGGREAVHFEPAATELVCRYSQGIPRLVNALCDRALLAAYVRGTRRISGYLMGQAVGELTPMLSVTEPPPPHLTHDEPTPRPELRRTTRPDAALRLALLGLGSLLIGLFVVWWRAGSIEERFPTALQARESPLLSAPMPIPAPELAPDVAPAPAPELAPDRLVDQSETVVSPTVVPPPTSAAPPGLPDPLPLVRVPLLPMELVEAPVSEPEPRSTRDEFLALRTDHAALRLPAPSRPESPKDATRDGGPSGEASDPAGWYLDTDGVIRAETPEQAEQAAIFMLLRQWDVMTQWPPSNPIDPALADSVAVARDHRLELLHAPLSVDELVRLDYPAIVYRIVDGAPPSPVVFSRVAGNEVTLLDPRAGLVRRPVQEVARELADDVRLYWRPLNGWRWPGPINGPDPVIGWMQRRLRERQLYRGTIDGLLGPETEQALQRWAGQRGLSVPLAAPMLELLISQLLAPAEFPRLSQPDPSPLLPVGHRELPSSPPAG